MSQGSSEASEGAISSNPSHWKANPLNWLLTALLLVLIASVITVGALSRSSAGEESELVKDSQYQAVFLTNGQVYFGKLSELNDSFYQLTDIFYLQVQQQVQPTGSNGSTPTTAPASTDASQTQLVKLGEELHGPEDAMQISRTQVQFWENLKADGKVAQAIETYKKQ